MNIANVQHQKRIKRRTKILVIVLGLWMLGIAGRLVQLQLLGHARMRTLVLEQSQSEIEVLPERGAIYDRRGQVLAQSIPSFTIYYQPAKNESADAQLRPVLGLEQVASLESRDIERVKEALQNQSKRIQIKKKVGREAAEAIERMRLKGVYLAEETSRVYPQGPLAAHILGGISLDNKVKAGIEGKLDSILSGKKGRQVVLHDLLRREFNLEILEESKKGFDIVLTIDSTIQYIAEQELARSVRSHGVDWGTVIITQPATGDILALANWPAYDPNEFPTGRPDVEADRGVQRLYDPGSTFKIVTASAAIESRRVGLTELFDCSKGSIESAGAPIRDHKNFGILTFPDVIVHSSNVGSIMIGRRVGPEALLRTIAAFGFGEKTGVELPAEAAGIVHPVKEWTRRSIDSISIGYEISVTPIQVLQALNVIANGGDRVPPRIVKSIQGGTPLRLRPDPTLQPALSGETTRRLAEILEKAVREWTGQAARIPGYAIAGKTGTTQKIDPGTNAYSPTHHIASFVGFVPAENPTLSMIVVLDDPQADDYYGGQVAAPVFREIARRVLRYLGIPPRPNPPSTIVAANSERNGRP